jgi:transposase
MCCGRCCVTEPRSKPHLRLDIFIEIPIFVRTFSEEEHETLKKGLRSSDSFVLPRSQIILASARGEHPPRIAENLGCGSQTVRNAIHAFNERGLDALKLRSSRPRHLRTAFDEEGAKALREIVHEDPRNFGKEDAFWTLEYAAQVSFEQA